ncbi:possibl zinc metallo-peptidase [Sphingomonas mucosissima]|uniref:Possibl zinc metallo-peptidase n=2 Tax=Sphingomonas mucosissima TaxID=370959 RepID=A0A245ZIS0_9SPHN|nr:possibl zinc metallo-peptidase [Sphingomonas mucosissima]
MAVAMSGQDLPGEPPSLAAIERHARQVIQRLPDAFRAHLGNVVLLVEEEADAETLASVGLEHPLELTGVYHGRPIGDKSAFDSGAVPDRIHLYRQAILAEWCETGVRLDDLVAHVTIHEIGHHFGLSDDDMHALEDAVAD